MFVTGGLHVQQGIHGAFTCPQRGHIHGSLIRWERRTKHRANCAGQVFFLLLRQSHYLLDDKPIIRKHVALRCKPTWLHRPVRAFHI